jgi:hypothetical protein
MTNMPLFWASTGFSIHYQKKGVSLMGVFSTLLAIEVSAISIVSLVTYSCDVHLPVTSTS